MPETRTYTVYKFDELTDEQKEQAINNLYNMNVDFDWWECTYEQLEKEFKHMPELSEKYPFVDSVKVDGFELDRGLNADIRVDIDLPKMVAECFKDHKHCKHLTILAKNEYFGESYGEYITYGYRTAPRIDKLMVKLTEFHNEAIKELSEDIASMLQAEYDYLTSREAIEETIKANDYFFKEDGRIG